MLKTILLASVALVSVSVAALAADLPSRRAAPAYAPEPVIPAFSWTGGYIGVQVGYEFGRGPHPGSGFGDTGASSRDGVIGGGHIGYLYSTQSLPVFGSAFGSIFGSGGVIGLEGDVDDTSARRSFALGTINNTNREDIQGSVRGRLGVAFNRFLVYGTGGVAFGGIHDSYVGLGGGFDSFSHTRVGYTFGGGVEYAVTNNWSVGAEYRYTDFGTYTDTLVGAGVGTVRHHETDNRIQARISYKFDTFAPLAGPVVARY